MINFVGQKIGKLTPIKPVGRNKAQSVLWYCECECGGNKVVSAKNLRNGSTRSCGCMSSGRKLHDLTNRRFGRWLVISKSHKVRHSWYWNCVCDCGNTAKIRGSHLIDGKSNSCGCLAAELSAQRAFKHGECDENIYHRWVSMRQRCNDPNYISAEYYSKIGVKVCEEWDDYLVFKEWALGNGFQEDLEIHRLDNWDDYCPENCVWITKEKHASIHIGRCCRSKFIEKY